MIGDLTPALRSSAASNDAAATVRLPRTIDGELDRTTEIPLVRLLPPVPPAEPLADDDVDVWGYGWLFGLLLAVVLVIGYPLGQLLLAWSQR